MLTESCFLYVNTNDVFFERAAMSRYFQLILFDKHTPSMEKGFVLQGMVCSVLIQGFLIARTGYQQMYGNCSWLFFPCTCQVQTQPNKMFYFHRSCHWSDIPVAEIYQRNAALRVTANFPGDVLARARA